MAFRQTVKSIGQIRRENPQSVLLRNVENMGLRLGLDRLPASIRESVPIARRMRGPDFHKNKGFKSGIEPRWHRATLPIPEIVVKPKEFRFTLLGRFMIDEWTRYKKDAKRYHSSHGLPEHTLPNPFLRYKNPISNRWQSPVYGLRKQTELVREARRLGMMHILPSGPKTPTEYANTSLEVSKLYYAEDRETVIRKDVMGTIKWAGEYVPELNPFGAGKWAPGGIREGQEHSFNGIPYWGRYKGLVEMFKVTKRQKAKANKRIDVDARMRSMPQRIEAWKAEKEATKIASYSALPF